MVERSVSGQHNNLLLDLGNSYAKYAFVSAADESLSCHYVDYGEPLLSLLNNSSRVLLSSVSSAKYVEQIQNRCRSLGIDLFIATSQAQQFGLRCAYENYSTLGVDRWLAMLAADQMTELPFAVIDVGTAITCDFVANKQHLGGWIAPGFSTMRSGLIKNTQHVFSDSSIPDSAKLGLSTEQCVNFGCLAAVQGVVARAQVSLSLISSENCLIVTGGDQSMLQEVCGNKTIYAENLVLQGLRLFI